MEVGRYQGVAGHDALGRYIREPVDELLDGVEFLGVGIDVEAPAPDRGWPGIGLAGERRQGRHTDLATGVLAEQLLKIRIGGAPAPHERRLARCEELRGVWLREINHVGRRHLLIY